MKANCRGMMSPVVAKLFGNHPAGQPRVIVGNRTDGGVLFWTARLYLFGMAVASVLLMLAMLTLYRYAAMSSPPVPDFAKYAEIAPAVSRVYAADGTLMAEFAKEWREIVPYEKIPKQLTDAFLAVEDHDFFNHGGIYLKGIGRAVLKNATAGDFAQGGSTITQQVAKQFLGAEKSLWRKAKEAIMARRLEAKYSKKAILSVYLNHIYLGAGAWGVAAAARRYFQKDLDQLTMAECALIAGLAKAPTAFSPLRRLPQAIERRNDVLAKMQTFGFASADQIATARKEQVTLHPYRDVFPDRMPYYAEYVRGYLLKKYGADSVLADGMRVETAVEPVWEHAAYDNADYGARHQDKRQGWRGAEWTVSDSARELFINRQRQLYGSGDTPLLPEKRYMALVEKVKSDEAMVRIGDREMLLPLRNMRWAARWHSGNADNDEEVDSATRVLKTGNVVWVSREVRTLDRYREWELPDKHNPSWVHSNQDPEWDQSHTHTVKLEQVPHPQSAIFTADHRNGYVVSMVGGFDYDRSEFNRAVQACRQPGSTYKPIYYALALDEGYGFDTILNDVPVKIVDPDTGETWTPANLDDTMDGDVTMEYALVFSKNIPSVDIFQRLGAKNVEAWARRLGFTTKIFADDALALGASCVHLDEIARAFTVYARGGRWWPREAGVEKDWIYVRRIVDRSGVVIEDNTVADDANLLPADRLDRIAATAGRMAQQAIPARTAYLISKMLAQMVTHGFTNTLRATDIHAAGKTGTSSDTHDNSFISFTSRFTVATWLGDDKKERALGRKDAAYMTVVPLFARYMFDAARGFPNPEFPWNVPSGVNPKDRGSHSKGKKGPQMDLIFHKAEKPTEDGVTDGAPDPDGTGL
jgi:penicillin-binding protein 1A